MSLLGIGPLCRENSFTNECKYNMKHNLLYTVLAVIFLILPKQSAAQAPTLGTAADFVLFSSVGAVTNTGITHLTGHVGSNSGASTGFGNVDGVMHDQDPASALCAADLTLAYNQLNATIPTFFPGVLLGNGQTLNAGVYAIPAPATMNLILNLDGQGDPNAVFIFQINGTFSTGAGAKLMLLNGAQACNVFWKVEGGVNLAAGTTMRGTIIANNAAIVMSIGDTLEGRALSTNGAVSVTGITAFKPLGCGSPVLTGPANPIMGTTECFALFSGIGPVTNNGITNVIGDVGTNSGLTTGFNPLLVVGTVHPVPDGVTAQCGTDFTVIYNALNVLPYDIELLYPAQFGNNLVLTPHTYLMNGAVTFTDTLYLNAQGNPDAVFVIQINGAFGTSTYSNVVLQNGTQAKNVYWKIDGATDINDYSVFNGTIISQGAINLYSGVLLNGRALTGVGAVNTTAVTIAMPTSCAPFTTTEPMDQTACLGSSASFSVITTGIGLTYQWRRGAVNLIDGGNISGSNTATLTINPVTALDAAIDYNVIITGSFVPADTSNFVSLTIGSAAAITTQPTNVTVCAGDSTGFIVGATGAGLTYQWRIGLINLIDGGPISGAMNDTLVIDPVSALDAAMNYNVVVTGNCLPSAVSNNVELIIHSAPLITTPPTDQTACDGSTVNFTVVASGSGLTYQWRKGALDILNGGTVSGATTANLTINPIVFGDQATDYNVVISGTCQPNDTSGMVSLTIDTLTSITTQPINVTACAGDSVGFTVAATGSGLTYQWRIGLINLIDGGSVSGATNDTLTINPVILTDAATNYNVLITGACAPPLASNLVELDVSACLNDLSVVKTASTMTPTIGMYVTFTIVAGNTGGDATNVTVTDILQSGYTYVSSATTAGTYDPVAGIWNIGTMPDPATETLTIVAIVNMSGNYNNTAVIAGNGTDTSLGNNTSTIVLTPIEFVIPEGFSPNGDMVNDLFVIRGIENFPNNTFQVFNRWGNLVVEAAPYENEWDGKSNSDFNVGGDTLPVGTYFYVLDLGNGTGLYKGTIYLNK
jgi:gliding motility-associated-like protein/uncharacterized repeat protein (TIGR01451 family)